MLTITQYVTFVSALLLPITALAQEADVTADNAVVTQDQPAAVADEGALPEAKANDEITEERLLQEFSRYRRLLQEGTLDEADIAAKKIVEMTIKVYGSQSRETASALNNLGIVQHSNGQFDAAIQNFSSSIEIIEIVEDRLHGALVNPLKGLGAAQLGIGRPDKAEKTFTRAAHITHVNDGPHNLGQIEILESLAETQIQLRDTKQALSILDRIHIINVKYFKEDPMGLIPSLMSRARWQHRAGYYEEERVSYRRAIRIIQSGSDKNDPMLIEPLVRLGGSYYFTDLTSLGPKKYGLVTAGETYFKRAVRIAERSPRLDWRVRAKAKIALADYYTFSDSQNRSRKIYVEMWRFLSINEERLAFRNKWFKDPVPIIQNRLPLFVDSVAMGDAQRDKFLTGQIIVNYKVSSRGRVKNLRTEANPPEFTDMQRMVHREIRHRVHRPRIEESGAVSADDVVFEHTFSYLQADLDALRKANATATTNPKEKPPNDK